LEQLYAKKSKKLTAIIRYYSQRIFALLDSRQFDLLWIEKELLPSLPGVAEWLLAKCNIPYIVDYDDAIYHRYDQHKNPLIRFLLKNKIGRVMQHAKTVIVGNDYLATYAQKWQAPCIEILPTVIDLAHYPSAKIAQANAVFTIGWIGTPATQHYLQVLAPVLAKLCKSGQVQVHAVGARDLYLPGVNLNCLPWTETGEAAAIHNFDIGIMPLPDQAWEHGKCGYKLIQYMACSKAVIASPVGVNQQIVNQGVNGYLAVAPAEWLDAFENLQNDTYKKIAMGQAGRSKVEADYCLQVAAPRLHKIIMAACQ
jgi:glycosyltransferase involved in cell wall biosynthesis